jgi:putative addiction module killer protein
MIEVRQIDIFRKWLDKLKDERATARIAERVRRLSEGHFGDVRLIGDRISELRIHYGPGYRVYFTQHGGTFVLLLCGGKKDSQERDIKTAKMMAQNLEESFYEN